MGPHGKCREKLLFLPDSAYSPVHCICRRAKVWGTFGRFWKEEMRRSHLRVLADVWSLGLCSAGAVKPRGLCLFCWSLWNKHSVRDCQNSSCHGEKSRLRGCDRVYWWESRTKHHRALTFRTHVFTSLLLVLHLHCSRLMNVSYLLTTHKCCCVLLQAAQQNTGRVCPLNVLLFLKSNSKNTKMWRQKMETTCGDRWKTFIENNMTFGAEQYFKD